MNDLNYFLIFVILFVLFGLVKGYSKGFLRIAVTLASLIVVIFLATRVLPYVSDFVVERTPTYEKVRHKIVEIYAEKNSVLDNSIRENQDLTIESYDLPQLIIGSLIDNNTEYMYGVLAATIFEEYISGYLAKIVIKAGSFVGLIIVFGIVIFIVLEAVKILEKIPVLKTFNRLLGMVTGFSIALIWIWIFFIISMMFFADSLGVWLFAQINDSKLLTYLFNNNLLLKMIL